MIPTYTMPLRTENPVLSQGGRPAYRGPRSLRMGQTTTASAADMTKAKTQLAGMGVVALALSAGGTWVGLRTGLREKGFLSIAGWTVGVAAALTGLTSLGLLAAIPFLPAVPVTTPVTVAPAPAPAPAV